MQTDDADRSGDVRPDAIVELKDWPTLMAAPPLPNHTQVRCCRCDAPVSTQVPMPVFLRGWFECTECLNKGPWNKWPESRPVEDGRYLIKVLINGKEEAFVTDYHEATEWGMWEDVVSWCEIP